MQELSDRVVRVATVFSAADFAITLSFLEAHGILVVAQNFVFISNSPHMSNGVGGAPILVPERQAQDAVNLLIDADRGAMMLEGEPEPKANRSSKTWLSGLLSLLFYVFIGNLLAAPAYSSRIIHGRYRADGQSAENAAAAG